MFGISTQALFGQLLIGLINGAFYAILSLGLAVIFGLLNIINFTHGAQYMLGAFCAWFLLQYLGIGYWWSLLLAPIAVGLFGIIIERTMLSRLYKLDHLYGLLLTFGLALILQGVFTNFFGSSGLPYVLPPEFAGAFDLGFMYLPKYRAWVIVASLIVCFGTWFVIERTKLGSYLRAGTENAPLVQAFGINVPRMITLTYGFGVALAAIAGVMAAPIYTRQSADGREHDHRRVRRGGHRRHGIDPRRDPHGLRARDRRGPHESLLSRGVQHRDLRHHGPRAAGEAGRAVRARALRWPGFPRSPWRRRRRRNWIGKRARRAASPSRCS